MKKLKSLKWINDRFRHCRCQIIFLSDYRKISPFISSAVRQSRLTIVKKTFYQFNRGYTCVWLFKQSHLSLHSWPEYGFVTVSIEVCNFKGDDASKIDRLYRSLKKLFRPKNTNLYRKTTPLSFS